MPATQNYRLAEWHEPPALTASHELTVPDAEVYVGSSKECVQFVLLQGLQEITAYEGYPQLQQDIAQEIAEKIFDPEKDVAKALWTYLIAEQSMNSPAMPSTESPAALAEVVELRTRYVVTRYDVATGKLLPFSKQT